MSLLILIEDCQEEFAAEEGFEPPFLDSESSVTTIRLLGIVVKIYCFFFCAEPIHLLLFIIKNNHTPHSGFFNIFRFHLSHGAENWDRTNISCSSNTRLDRLGYLGWLRSQESHLV